ncbi:response regulator transcription factor [Planctomicrobium sp. SH668]|uniref:response regulator transcription factor n=1 Tax=Planctomicrobium sp. SH668 TaxID=3448126 RepID=UPI003F5C985F
MRDELTPVEIIVNRVLLVESDRNEASFLKEFLEGHHFRVESARDAGQARCAFNMHVPDFVILEAILDKDVSGFEVCEHFKRENNRVPVLMLTAIDMQDARNLAARVGVDRYLTKPYDPRELLSEIRSVAEFVWRKSHLSPGQQSISEDVVRFTCPKCEKHLKAKPAHRGRFFMCPRCQDAVVIPH